MVEKEKKLNSSLIFKGNFLTCYRDDVKCPNGRLATREYLTHPGAVCVLAFIDENRIIMERQYRYPFDSVIYELPAGKLDSVNEDLKEAAIRELEEETGYKALSLDYLGCIYPTVAYSNEVIHFFVTKELVKTQQHFDVDEYVEIDFIDINDVVKMINNNEINDAKTICLIGKYLMNNK